MDADSTMPQSQCNITVIVWTGWALLTAALATYVWYYGLPMPFADEFSMVSTATADGDMPLGWYWESHNDHRHTLQRFSYVAAGKLTGFDFRRMALANVVYLSLAAAILQVVAARAAGGARLAHLAIPALLLHLGHQVNLTWAFQMNLTLYALCAVCLLALIVSTPRRLSPAKGALAALCAVLLAMTGTFGVVYLPFAALWLIYAGWLRCRIPDDRATAAGVVLIVLGVALFAVCGAYAYWFPKVEKQLLSPSFSDTLTGAINLATVGLGPVGGSTRWISSPAICGASAVGLYYLFRAWRGRAPKSAAGDDRLAAVGLALFWCAGIALVAAIAIGRAGQGATMQTRYALLSVPLLLCLLLMCLRYVPLPNSRGLGIGLTAVLVVAIGANEKRGLRDGRTRYAWMTEIAVAAQAQTPYAELGRRYAAQLQCPPDQLAKYLEQLYAAQLGPYRDVPDYATADANGRLAPAVGLRR